MRFSFILVAIVLAGASFITSGADEPSIEARQSDSFDRISQNVMQGGISRKDAVILKAKLIFDHGAALSVAEKEVVGNDGPVIAQPCMTSFYTEVHMVYDELSDEERQYLCSLGENLRIAMESEAAKLSGAPFNSLPNFNLDKKLEGAYCVVNYTTTGDNAVPDSTFPELVKRDIDLAARIESKLFRAAYTEGGGKLQIYLIKDDVAYGTWFSVGYVAGFDKKRRSGYITISTIQDASRKDRNAALKGICFHEYFHGVQAAYNWYSSLWFREGSSVWAETYLGKSWPSLPIYFGASLSCFQKPRAPLWEESFHMYSTVAWVYHLADKFKGAAFIKEYLEATENQDDAILIFKDILSGKGSSFDKEFKDYAWEMYNKKIRSIKKYMPDVKKEEISTYGTKVNSYIYLTGLSFMELTPAIDISEATLLMNYVPDKTGSPRAHYFKAKSKDVKEITVSTQEGEYPDFVESFGKRTKEVCVFVADTDYNGEDSFPHEFKFDLITPRFRVKNMTAETPIDAGATTTIMVNYDLDGTHSDLETFPIALKVTRKNAKVIDNVSGDHGFAIGKNKTSEMYFNTGSDAKGPYAFSFEYRTPCTVWSQKWALPQVSSPGKCSVTVNNTAPGGGSKPFQRFLNVDEWDISISAVGTASGSGTIDNSGPRPDPAVEVLKWSYEYSASTTSIFSISQIALFDTSAVWSDVNSNPKYTIASLSVNEMSDYKFKTWPDDPLFESKTTRVTNSAAGPHQDNGFDLSINIDSGTYNIWIPQISFDSTLTITDKDGDIVTPVQIFMGLLPLEGNLEDILKKYWEDLKLPSSGLVISGEYTYTDIYDLVDTFGIPVSTPVKWTVSYTFTPVKQPEYSSLDW